MNCQPHLVWKGLDPSPALEERIREELATLDTAHDHIVACRVVVEQPHHHQHRAPSFSVKVEVSVPGHVLVATGGPDVGNTSTDARMAVAEAFEAIRGQLERAQQMRRGHVKSHHQAPT